MKLDSVPDGCTVKIEKTGGSTAVRRRLLELGLTAGTAVTVCKRAPLGDPLLILVRGYEQVIRRSVAREIEVGRG